MNLGMNERMVVSHKKSINALAVLTLVLNSGQKLNLCRPGSGWRNTTKDLSVVNGL